MVSARRILLLVLVLASLTALVDAQRPSSDWTQWRGPNRDGAIAGFTAPATWPKALTQRWKAEVGPGYATPLVVGNRVYMFSRLGDNETMTALDADSGKVLWQQGYPAVFTMHVGRCAPRRGTEVDAGRSPTARIYSIGMTGIVTAWDAASGKKLWQKPGSTLVPIYTTHAFSPVVDRGIVIFHVGGHDKGALTAFDVAHRCRALELDGRRTRLRLTDDCHDWRHAPGHHHHTGEDGRRRRVQRHAPLGASVCRHQHDELDDADRVRADASSSAATVARSRRTRRPARARPWVAPKLWENADATMRMSNGVIVATC